MKKIIIILLLIGVVVVSGCTQIKIFQIGKEIEKANYCETKEDCANAGSRCPLGCDIHVNVNEVDRIKALMNTYQPDCEFLCDIFVDVECTNNKCVVINLRDLIGDSNQTITSRNFPNSDSYGGLP